MLHFIDHHGKAALRLLANIGDRQQLNRKKRAAALRSSKMAQNLSFARGGTSSWADDDDVDFQPLPVAPRSRSTSPGYA